MQLISKKNRVAIYSYLLREGVAVANPMECVTVRGVEVGLFAGAIDPGTVKGDQYIFVG